MNASRRQEFFVAGPYLWNSLPVTLCDRDISLVQFKRLLEILLFVRLRHIVTVAFLCRVQIFLLTYLHLLTCIENLKPLVSAVPEMRGAP